MPMKLVDSIVILIHMKQSKVKNNTKLPLSCRMPDPDFSVSDVKLFVGKILFYSHSE